MFRSGLLDQILQLFCTGVEENEVKHRQLRTCEEYRRREFHSDVQMVTSRPSFWAEPVIHEYLPAFLSPNQPTFRQPIGEEAWFQSFLVLNNHAEQGRNIRLHDFQSYAN